MPTTTKTLDALGEATLYDYVLRAFVILALAGCLCGWLGWTIPAGICLALVVLCGGVIVYLDSLIDELRLGRDEAGFIRTSEEGPTQW